MLRQRSPAVAFFRPRIAAHMIPFYSPMVLRGRCTVGAPGGNLNYSGTFSGTSAAAPQVAGVLALLASASPPVRGSQARARIVAAADYWVPSGSFGAGKLNALFTLSPLAVWVDGPTGFIVNAGTQTWTAYPTGGTGSFTYQWEYQDAGSSTWDSLGTGQSQDRYIDGSIPAFTIRVMVTSGSLNRPSSPAYCCSVTWDAFDGVALSGTSYVRPGLICTWTAAPQGGIPPYTYDWPGTSGPDDTWSWYTSEGSFSVSVTVTDAAGLQVSNSQDVYVEEGAPGC